MTADPADTGTRTERRMVSLEEPAMPPRTAIATCLQCMGHGKVRMNVHDVLAESIALIADNPDPVIIKFYDRLFAIDPSLVAIFPPDLLSAPTEDKASKGVHQRDQLVGALVKVATLYGAGEREEQELDTVLRQAGRSHATITWPADGRVGPPLRHHWDAVRRALFETLHEVAGPAWLPVYDTVWGEAYDHAETEMKHAIQHEGRAMQVARTRRETAERGGGRDWKEAR